MFSAIWAEDENGLIGAGGKLPWHLPADLNYFKEKTVGHRLVMGKATFLGMGARPLPQRTTLLLTRDQDFSLPKGVERITSLAEFIDKNQNTAEEIFIAGGAGTYQLFLPYTKKLYRTKIRHAYAGDTHFPAVDWAAWHLCSSVPGPKDAEQPDYFFEIWGRNE